MVSPRRLSFLFVAGVVNLMTGLAAAVDVEQIKTELGVYEIVALPMPPLSAFELTDLREAGVRSTSQERNVLEAFRTANPGEAVGKLHCVAPRSKPWPSPIGSSGRMSKIVCVIRCSAPCWVDRDPEGLVNAIAGADEAALVGEHDELSAVADGELHHRSVDMCLDRER